MQSWFKAAWMYTQVLAFLIVCGAVYLWEDHILTLVLSNADKLERRAGKPLPATTQSYGD